MAIGQGVYWGSKGQQAQFARETTFGTQAATLSQVVLLDEPTVDEGIPEQSQDGMYGRGSSEQFADDSNPGTQSPNVKFSFVWNDLFVSQILATLFQGGSTLSGTAPYLNTCVAWTDFNPATYKGFTFVKNIAPGGTNAARVATGCLAKQMTVTAERGKPVRVDVEAYAFAVARATVASVSTVLAGTSRRLYSNTFVSHAAVGGSPAALLPPARKWSLVLSNNAEYDPANQQTPYAIPLGPMDVSGSIDLSYRGDFITFLGDLITIGSPVQRLLRLSVGSADAATTVDNFNAKCDVEWTTETDKADGNIQLASINWKQKRATTSGQATTLLTYSTGDPATAS